MKPSRSFPRRRLLASALALAVLAPMGVALAADTDADTDADTPRQPRDLDAVVVTASPLKGSAESLAKPVEVLVGEELDRSKAATLGDTVSKLPGVQTTFFGTGVGRNEDGDSQGTGEQMAAGEGAEWLHVGRRSE